MSTTIELIKQCGMSALIECQPGWLENLQRFADLVAEAEREECAKICESTPLTSDIDWWRKAIKREVYERSARECAAAIRASGTP